MNSIRRIEAMNCLDEIQYKREGENVDGWDMSEKWSKKAGKQARLCDESGAVDKVQEIEVIASRRYSKHKKRRPNGVKQRHISSFLSSWRLRRGGSGPPLPLSLA